MLALASALLFFSIDCLSTAYNFRLCPVDRAEGKLDWPIRAINNQTIGRLGMATYVVLGNYTDKGIGAVKDSPKRLDATRDLGKGLGVTLKDLYLCMGAHDFVWIMESNSDENVAQFMLALGSRGNVRTTTMHAFSEAQYRKIIGVIN